MVAHPAHKADSKRRPPAQPRAGGQQQARRYPRQSGNFDFRKRKRQQHSCDQRQLITLNFVPLQFRPFQPALTCMNALRLTILSRIAARPIICYLIFALASHPFYNG